MRFVKSNPAQNKSSLTLSLEQKHPLCPLISASPIRRSGFAILPSEQTGHSFLGCDIWLLLMEGMARSSVLRQANHKREEWKARKGRVESETEPSDETAGQLHQSVINEPTGRWDYMPNCTSNQSIAK